MQCSQKYNTHDSCCLRNALPILHFFVPELCQLLPQLALRPFQRRIKLLSSSEFLFLNILQLLLQLCGSQLPPLSPGSLRQ